MRLRCCRVRCRVREGNRPFWSTVIADSTDSTALQTAITDIIKSGAELGTIIATGDIEWETGASHGSTPLVPAGSSLETLIIDGGDEGATLTVTGKGIGPIAAKNGGTLVFKNMTIVDESVSYAENSWEMGYLDMAGTLVFENCTFVGAVMVDMDNGQHPVADATFVNCTFGSTKESEYDLWIGHGTATITNCTFTNYRGLKIHEAYGSDVDTVIVDGCTFGPLSVKPGIAIGDVDATTVVTVKNSTFNKCQAGDQGLYIYETDTAVDTFNFTLTNNTVK